MLQWASTESTATSSEFDTTEIARISEFCSNKYQSQQPNTVRRLSSNSCFSTPQQHCMNHLFDVLKLLIHLAFMYSGTEILVHVTAFYDCFHVQEQYTECFNSKEPKHLLTSNTWENEDLSYKHCAFKKVLKMNKQVFHHMKLQTQISKLTRDQPCMSSRRNHTTGDLRAWGTLLGGY